MSFDGDSQEARRNTTIAISVAVAAVTMVALLYWLFSSLTGPALAVAPAAVTSTATPTGTPVPTQSERARADELHELRVPGAGDRHPSPPLKPTAQAYAISRTTVP